MYVNARVESGASLTVLSQASTKVYAALPISSSETIATTSDRCTRCQSGFKDKLRDNAEAVQIVDVQVSSDAFLLWLPEPVVPYAHSRYRQIQRFNLESHKSSCVLLDWFTGGRTSRGETWHAESICMQLDVSITSKLYLRDRINIKRDGTSQMYGSYNAYATIILFGDKVSSSCKRLHELYFKTRIRNASTLGYSKPEEIVWSLSPLSQDKVSGVFIRIGAANVSQIRNFLTSTVLCDIKEAEMFIRQR